LSDVELVTLQRHSPVRKNFLCRPHGGPPEFLFSGCIAASGWPWCKKL
jgi:hypothetical protein